jgi:hypothetical protein
VRTRVRILVKAFPQHSDEYQETVCCAGVTDDAQLIRLYPITYRLLAQANQFKRYDLMHFIMGNMAKRHWQFIVIGLLRSGLDPQEIAKQGSLF